MQSDKSLVFRFFEEQVPFNRWMGLHATSIKEGELRVRMPFRPDMTGDPMRPAIHGGVIAALLDATGGAALFTVLGEQDRASTVDLRVDYLKPGQCQDVLAVARLVRLGNRMATVEMRAFHDGEEESPFALGIGVYNVRRGLGPTTTQGT